MPFDDVLRDVDGPQRGSEALRPDRAPVSVHGDPDARRPAEPPAEAQSPADEEAQSPLDTGFSMPALPDEPALAREPNVDAKANVEATDLLSLLPFL
jgi:hypothetical protein